MSAPEELDRYEREQRYHDQRYAEETRVAAKKYYAASPSDERYRALLDSVAAGERVLEYGCGPGSAAFDLAARGVDVIGIDISSTAIEQATQRAAELGLSSVTFEQMNAEHLSLPDASFDVVCGSGILHHLELDRAYAEVHRVLRPGGRGIFLEPMGHNPVINLYRRATPSMRTPDEHPLLFDDIDDASAWFGSVGVEYFQALALLAIPLRRTASFARIMGFLARADAALFRRLPVWRRLAWTVVIVVSEPRQPAPPRRRS